MAEVNLFRETICGIFQFIRVSRTFERNLCKGDLLSPNYSVHIHRNTQSKETIRTPPHTLAEREQRSHQFS